MFGVCGNYGYSIGVLSGIDIPVTPTGFPQCKDFSVQKAKLCGGGVNISSIYNAIFPCVHCLSLLSNPTSYVGSTIQIRADYVIRLPETK